ncbi:MAG: class II D-tagatose-bisphosphate aldolase, non-catalytic subunit [Rhodobacteraceae bacterium]|nr:class II D-tagatose-bisphosphate aldolase, non-catalytic subunit [Paracoccaceae bacterium]
MSAILNEAIRQNRAGAAVSIPSVCSAHPDVLRAALLLAQELDQALIIEATSNQVNQFGGYTGMRPADFVRMVTDIAKSANVDRERIILGGDHLGPQVWRAGTAADAMRNARQMVAEYVAAGFSKIHLDCSEGCAGEGAQVSDTVAAERSADLAAACADATSDPGTLAFVIGTEVPPPGGARGNDAQQIVPTSPDAAEATLHAHHAAFQARGLASQWHQVCALVVQPGVEFSPTEIHTLPPETGADMRDMLKRWPGLAFEAHSTDYQTPATYPRLASMGFAIQKVGPALTFAWRQAVYGLDMIGRAAGLGLPVLSDVLEQEMRARPEHWRGHYPQENTAEARLLRHFSYADRIRYYWTTPAARDALVALFDGLSRTKLPRPALQQCFSVDVIDRADGLRRHFPDHARALAAALVQATLRPYFVT